MAPGTFKGFHPLAILRCPFQFRQNHQHQIVGVGLGAKFTERCCTFVAGLAVSNSNFKNFFVRKE